MPDGDGEVYGSADSGGRHPEQAFCVCGSAWFVAQVALTHDGSLNGHAGPLVCVDCDESYPLGWTGAITPDGGWFDPNG